MRARRGRFAVLVPLLAAGLAGFPVAAVAETPDTPTPDAAEPFDGTHSLVGSYLAGRFARAQNDTVEAAEFYQDALIHDPKNELLLEQAFQIEAARADWPRAFKLAEALIDVQKNHRMAQLALALRDFKAGSWRKCEEHFRLAGAGPIGELTSAMGIAWTDYAQGEVNTSLADLDLPKQAEWAQFFLRFHKALIADVAGRRSEARAAYDSVYSQDTRTLRTALAFARHVAHAGDRKRAIAVIDEHIEKSQGDGHPLLRSLKEAVEQNRKIDLIVTDASDGMAEVFYGLGEALIGEGAVGVGMLYMQMALYIEPQHQFALAALASAYEGNKQYADAIRTYDAIGKDSPLATAIEIRKAFNLNSLDKVDEARETLTKLLEEPQASAVSSAAAQPAVAGAPVALPAGEVLRIGEHGDAVLAVQQALAKQGYDVGGEPDGKFGEGTRDAVKAFQKKGRLKADGLVGQDTFKAIVGENGMVAAGGGSEGSAGPLPLTVSDKLEILDAIGNIMRARKMYSEAIPYYDRAIALLPKPEKRHWVYYYARGTSYERVKNWPAAEADLEKALSLYPDQPLILNYLGYSWVDQGRNLKEGMAHIEKAVALKPDDGYIVDSLGWAHYMQGNYKEAVRYLERAVELKPDDPVLNDHLGDALWRVGREREARYQWDESLSLKPEPEDEAKIKKKLESGLTSDATHATNEPGKQAAKTDEIEQK